MYTDYVQKPCKIRIYFSTDEGSLVLHDEAGAETGDLLEILGELLVLLLAEVVDDALDVLLLDFELLEEVVGHDMVDDADDLLLGQLAEVVLGRVQLLQVFYVVLEHLVQMLLARVLLAQRHRMLQLRLHVVDYGLPLLVALGREPVQHLLVPHILGDVQPRQDAVQADLLQLLDLGLVFEDELDFLQRVLSRPLA